MDWDNHGKNVIIGDVVSTYFKQEKLRSHYRLAKENLGQAQVHKLQAYFVSIFNVPELQKQQVIHGSRYAILLKYIPSRRVHTTSPASARYDHGWTQLLVQ